VLDGTAGLWCVNAGHARASIVEAIKQQAETLDFASSFQIGHPGAFRLATQLVAIMPAGLNRVFFTNSGSESVDTALKMALAYQRANGQPARTRFIGRERAYHGTNIGGTAVGGIGGNRRSFGIHLPGVDHLTHTHRKSAVFTRGLPSHNDDFGAELERLIALHGAENVAAVIVEPVAGATGILLPPKGYLESLREITGKHGILLIFVEVITGFGRLGAPTAAEFFGVTPDIITLAKGLTNGTVPMGAVVTSQEIHDAIVSGERSGIEFPHGYTYSGHPLAAAAGIATLNLYSEEGLFERARQLADYWAETFHSLRGVRHVTDIRTLGLLAGIELDSRSDAPGGRAFEIYRRCLDDGLLVRAAGDVIALSPPLIIEKSHINEIAERLRKCLSEVA
jgi:beta-alanine--pyruvate transaminase